MNWFNKVSNFNKIAEYEEQKIHFDKFYEKMKEADPDFADDLIVESWIGYIPNDLKVPSSTGYKLKPEFYEEMRRYLAGKNILLEDVYKAQAATPNLGMETTFEPEAVCTNIQGMPWKGFLDKYIEEWIVDSKIEEENEAWKESLENADLELVKEAVDRFLLHLRKRWCPKLFRQIMGGSPEISDPVWKKSFKEHLINKWGYNPFEGEDWESQSEDDTPSADELREQWGF